MIDRGEQDVPPWLVRLRFDREPHVVALVDRVLGQRVDPLAVAVQGRAEVIGEVDLGAFPAALEDVDLRAELSGQVHVGHHLAQGVATDRAVVAGEPTVFEHRVAEQVRGENRQHHPGVGHRCRPALP